MHCVHGQVKNCGPKMNNCVFSVQLRFIHVAYIYSPVPCALCNKLLIEIQMCVCTCKGIFK